MSERTAQERFVEAMRALYIEHCEVCNEMGSAPYTCYVERAVEAFADAECRVDERWDFESVCMQRATTRLEDNPPDDLTNRERNRLFCTIQDEEHAACRAALLKECWLEER